MLGSLENGGHLRVEKRCFWGVVLGKVTHRKYEIAPSPKPGLHGIETLGCLCMAHWILCLGLVETSPKIQDET